MPATASFFLNVFRTVAGTPVTAQRPNVLGAHVVGDVYGAAADARLTITAPALPSDAYVPVYAQCLLRAVQTESGAAAANTLGALLKVGAFATVIGDDALLTLADAEISALVGNGSNGPALPLLFPTGNGNPAVLNINAGVNGRRGNLGGMVQVTKRDGFAPGTTLGVYLVVLVAFAPPALESVTLYPVWLYNARGT